MTRYHRTNGLAIVTFTRQLAKATGFHARNCYFVWRYFDPVAFIYCVGFWGSVSHFSFLVEMAISKLRAGSELVRICPGKINNTHDYHISTIFFGFCRLVMREYVEKCGSENSNVRYEIQVFVIANKSSRISFLQLDCPTDY